MLGLLLSACGSSEQGETPQPAAAVQASKPVPTKPESSNSLANMVKAVPTTPGENRLELRFVLPKQPVLGEPFDLNLNVLGLADASGLELKVTPNSKLELVTGGEATFGALKAGESVGHTLQLRASAAGISVIDVRLIATVGGNPGTADFTIPVALVDNSGAAVTTAGK
jgi:hypothetical protein